MNAYIRATAIALALGAVCGSAAAQANNPFARPSSGGAQPPVPMAGGVPLPAHGQPPMQYPGNQNWGGPAIPEKPDAEEKSIVASHIGTINGVRIYRGDNTYLFEKVSDRKIIRKVATDSTGTTGVEFPPSQGMPGAPARPSAAAPAAQPKQLPTSVGGTSTKPKGKE